MKTKKFIELIEDAGFKVDKTNNYLIVKDVERGIARLVATVSIKKEYVIDTNGGNFEKLDYDTRAFITSTLYAYSQTPISDRETIELSYVELIILESLEERFDTLMWSNSLGGLVVKGCGGLISGSLDAFNSHFKWVKKGKKYHIEDLLDAE
ncbi:hypothetical protein [Jeotgalibaca porci]|uniref:hypothetical protein n=1 Tax=Jeotgalibaca porci TaxID=1868793 RepID=UPI0035A06761